MTTSKSSDTLNVVVRGDSMWPTICDGDEVPCEVDVSLNVGDVVLSIHPLKPNTKIVKRITKIDSRGQFFLEGDNPDPIGSTDSHAFGYVALDQIIGRIIFFDS